jgi:hypothetical protein
VPIILSADLSFKPSADLSQCRFVLHPYLPSQTKMVVSFKIQ